MELIGNLGADPEVRYTPDGIAVTNIRLATDEVWRDKETGQLQKHTEWHRLVFWRRNAEVAGKYLRKGSRILIEGHLRTRPWRDSSGSDRYTTEIYVRDFEMLNGSGDTNGEGRQATPTERGRNDYAASFSAKAPAAKASAPPYDDKDIPF